MLRQHLHLKKFIRELNHTRHHTHLRHPQKQKTGSRTCLILFIKGEGVYCPRLLLCYDIVCMQSGVSTCVYSVLLSCELCVFVVCCCHFMQTNNHSCGKWKKVYAQNSRILITTYMIQTVIMEDLSLLDCPVVSGI